jgi:hypothetical protein
MHSQCFYLEMKCNLSLHQYYKEKDAPIFVDVDSSIKGVISICQHRNILEKKLKRVWVYHLNWMNEWINKYK